MPAQNIIELGFNIDELTAEKKQVLDLFVDLFGKLKEYDGTKFNPLGGGGLADLKKSINDGAQAMGEFQAKAAQYNQTITDQVAKHQEAKKASDALASSQKTNVAAADGQAKSQDQLRRLAAQNKVAMEDLAATIGKLRSAYAEGNIAAEDYAKRLEPLLAQQLSLKVANGDVTKTLTVLEKQFQSAAGSTVQLENRLKELQHVYDNLSPEGKNADAGKALLSEIKDVDAAFKALKGDTGRFQDNVGNYAGSLSPAFAAVREQLAAINSQIGAMEQKAQGVQNFGARTVVVG